MRIFRILLDEYLDRTPECLNSERDVDVSVRVRSLLRGITEELPENLVLIRCSIERRAEDFVETGTKFWRWLKSVLAPSRDSAKG